MASLIARVSWSETAYWVLISTLFGLAGFFAHEVEQFRREMSSQGEVLPGAWAVFEGLEGESPVLSLGSRRRVATLLGIESLEAWATEESVVPHRQAARELLESFRGQRVRLDFEDFRVDGEGRIVTYLTREGQDLGRDLLRRGLALAATEAPHPRLRAYLKEERQAFLGRRGLWGSSGARRVLDLSRSPGE